MEWYEFYAFGVWLKKNIQKHPTKDVVSISKN